MSIEWLGKYGIYRGTETKQKDEIKKSDEHKVCYTLYIEKSGYSLYSYVGEETYNNMRLVSYSRSVPNDYHKYKRYKKIYWALDKIGDLGDLISKIVFND